MLGHLYKMAGFIAKQMVGNQLKSVEVIVLGHLYKMAGFIAKQMVGNQLKSVKGNCASSSLQGSWLYSQADGG